MRRPQLFLQDKFAFDFAFPQITANFVTDLLPIELGRSLVIDRIVIASPGALAASDTNYVFIQVLNVAALASQWSTKLTGGDGPLVAGVGVLPTLSGTVANLNVASGAKLRFNVTVTGAPTLPAGTCRVEGRLL